MTRIVRINTDCVCKIKQKNKKSARIRVVRVIRVQRLLLDEYFTLLKKFRNSWPLRVMITLSGKSP